MAEAALHMGPDEGGIIKEPVKSVVEGIILGFREKDT